MNSNISNDSDDTRRDTDSAERQWIEEGWQAPRRPYRNGRGNGNRGNGFRGNRTDRGRGRFN